MPKQLTKRTEHPHIETVAGVSGGRPVIAGTRMSVDFIARLHRQGEAPLEIMAAYPHLAPAAIYDAISYYLDHQQEIDDWLEATRPEHLQAELGFQFADNGAIFFPVATPVRPPLT